jgi:hypothetical protein
LRAYSHEDALAVWHSVLITAAVIFFAVVKPKSAIMT